MIHGGENISINPGKIFESDFKSSIPDSCWVYRLRDNASSFANGKNTRFTSSNICDYIMFDDNTRSLYLIECKSTKSTSMPFTMLRENQIEGLKEASKHKLFAGILINFRNSNNDTFFLLIDQYLDMIGKTNKKSFNIKDLNNIGALKISSSKKRTHYRYDIVNFVNDLHIK